MIKNKTINNIIYIDKDYSKIIPNTPYLIPEYQGYVFMIEPFNDYNNIDSYKSLLCINEVLYRFYVNSYKNYIANPYGKLLSYEHSNNKRFYILSDINNNSVKLTVDKLLDIVNNSLKVATGDFIHLGKTSRCSLHMGDKNEIFLSNNKLIERNSI